MTGRLAWTFGHTAVGRHIALIGFMGAGKTTVGREVARLTERPFVDVDEEIVARHGPIPDLFEAGEPGFRRFEERVAADALAAREPRVVALGGGALGSAATRRLLRETAFTVLLSVEVEEAWRRVRASDRPLAQSEDAFRRLYEARQPVYRETADAAAADVDGVLLAALRVDVRRRAAADLAQRFGGERAVALVADEHVLALHAPDVDERFFVHPVPRGERAKTLTVVEDLWRALRIGRDALLVALGGGSTTDVAGFVAATYLRGVSWVAVPTTLVGQVDAAIGGKTGIDLPEGKNLVGAFHLPVGVVVDADLLATLPKGERRNGLAEIVKTGLLAGRPLWDLPEEAMVRACAAFKCAVVLSDPFEQGRRAVLNLGHTFAHALETASDYTVSHGDAVALGLLAALRLSGEPTDVVAELLRPEPVRVDRERAWAALGRDKKAAGGRTRLVLLRGPGEPEHGVELPDGDVRAALNELIRE
jgi:3-dehydroquinate synthetase/shikimate kinase